MASIVSMSATKERSTSVTVAASPLVIEMKSMPFPTTVVAVPGGGGTIGIEYSCSTVAISNPSSATWIAWPDGVVAVSTAATLISPVIAMRITVAVATGTVEFFA